METKYIVSLREDINLGRSVTRLLTGVSFDQNQFSAIGSFIAFRLPDEREILVNKNNVKAIVPMQER